MPGLEFSLQDEFFGFTEEFDDYSITVMALGSADGRFGTSSKQIWKDTKKLGEIAEALVGEYESCRRL